MQHKYALYAWFIVAIGMLVSVHYYAKWSDNIIGGGDSWGYYLYLPALFIHGDLDNLKTSLETRKSYHPGYYTTDVNPLGVDEVHHVGNGKQVNKYTCGIAIIETPLFFIAHGIAKITGRKADGYSWIYIYMMTLSSPLFVLWSLLYLRRFLLNFFKEHITAIILLILGLGTNLYYFSVHNNAMSHSYLFGLYCFLLYHTYRYHQTGRTRNAVPIGLVAGLITLIRPTEIICLLIPILYGIDSLKAAKEKWAFIMRHKKSNVLAIGTYILMGVPQLIYWKYTAGEFLYYSYGEEGFDFAHPQIIKGIFGYRNGWLAYTPLMYLALAGIPLLFLKNKRDFLLPVLTFLPLHIWVTYSWWCWYYVNGFGSRPMVQSYALLSIPLGWFLVLLFKRHWSAVLAVVISCLLIFLNLFQTYKFDLGVLWSEDANKAYYFSTFFKTKIEMKDLVTYDSGIAQPNPNELKKIKPLGQLTFEDSLDVHVLPTPPHDGFAFRLNAGVQYTPAIHLPVKEYGITGGQWLRASVKCMKKYQQNALYKNSMIVVHMERDGINYYWKDVRLDNKPGNTKPHLWGGQPDIWDEVVFWYKVPNRVKATDYVKVYCWNFGSPEIFVDDLTLELWEHK